MCGGVGGCTGRSGGAPWYSTYVCTVGIGRRPKQYRADETGYVCMYVCMYELWGGMLSVILFDVMGTQYVGQYRIVDYSRRSGRIGGPTQVVSTEATILSKM